ncbi:hypothetical protein EMPS_09111 [Entomortierella parvispora]|uniref:Arrestin C-terminal-like domain-containing protein n=1 Tax=Entomortierella parvispora TaxID=205924 RepID=A0A9P3HHK6_9FUNG|nr:hypothetical protein EMPS_09111 [Entomortierella parvispora]
MLRLARSLPFFNQQEANPAQSFIHPANGFSISVPTKCSLDNYYGPGTVFNGQLNLQLVKHISSPCRLKVILTCYHTIPEALSPAATLEHQHSDTVNPSSAASAPRNSSSSASSSLSAGSGSEHYQQPHLQLFTVEHVLVEDQALVAKRHSYLFNIKFPRVNLPASMTDGDRSVAYSIHGELSFETNAGDIASKGSVCSPAVHLKYLPLVPTSIPHFPVIEMAQVQDPYTGQTLFKATLQSPQRGICPGESLPLSITLANESDTELQFVHLSLVRVISYPNAAPTQTTPAPTPEPVTVHSVTLPITKANNKQSTWVEAIQFKVPSNLGLIPTTNKVITPLYKVDYYISVSLPVASRHTGLASWFTPAIKGPPPVDISLIRPNTDATATAGSNGAERRPTRKTSGDKLIRINLHQDRITTVNSSMKWPTLIQLPLVPVIIGTVPYNVTERQLRWPIPNYLDVMDRPRFVRDRFEEEMIQHLKSLENMIVDEDDEQDIENLVRAATRSGSSSESDDEEQQKASTRIPLRFRDRVAHRPGSGAGLGTPPPSPPQGSPIDTIASGIHTLPRMTRRSMSPRATGLGKELLLEMHHSKLQQSIQSGLHDM